MLLFGETGRCEFQAVLLSGLILFSGLICVWSLYISLGSLDVGVCMFYYFIYDIVPHHSGVHLPLMATYHVINKKITR